MDLQVAAKLLRIWYKYLAHSCNTVHMQCQKVSENECSSPCMNFCASIVVFTAPFPHTIVWCAVGSFNIEYKILNEVNLISGVHNLEDKV